MNNVYFPAHVVVILRRIANVISGLSISNQYLLLKRARAEERDGVHLGPVPTAARFPTKAEWPEWMGRAEWDWLRFMTSGEPWLSLGDSVNVTVGNSILKSSVVENSGGYSNVVPNAPPLNNETRQSMPSNGSPQPRKEPMREPQKESLDTIHRLIQNPALYNPLRRPRYPIVLCHGLYGFDVRGPAAFPSLRMQYWSNVLDILRKKVGAEVIVTAVPGTGSITSRSENLDRLLQEKARGRGINLMAHSMGGLDCRRLISHIRPTEYTPLSLTTISTPHRGSPFMDWCAENIGLGRLREQELENSKATLAQESAVSSTSATSATKAESAAAFSLSFSALPSSFTTLLMSVLDSPAYSNLTSTYLNTVFNPSTPDDPRVKYFSVAGRLEGMSVWHPLWLPKMVLDGFEDKGKETLRKEWEETQQGQERLGQGQKPVWEREDEWGNDGLVTVQSARWGEFLGTLEGCDHWEMRGARGIELNVELPPLGIGSLTERGDGWGFKDWGKFVGAWKKQEQKDDLLKEGVGGGGAWSKLTTEEQVREQAQDDAIIKSSTDKISAVFDWLVEQVPASPRTISTDKDSVNVETEQAKKVGKGDLATKMDLERFYVALSRKLYDAGL